MEPRDPTTAVHDVSLRIAELRSGCGLTQEAMAEKLGVSDKYLQRVEAGQENLTIRSLARIAAALGEDVSALFVKPDRRERKPGRPPRRR